MLSNCKYNKIKLLQELSHIAWFLDKCGISDAEKSGHSDCAILLKALRTNLETHIDNLEKALKKG